MRKSYLDRIFGKPGTAVRVHTISIVTIFELKTRKKQLLGYHLLSILKNFRIIVAFPYLKANSKGIPDKIYIFRQFRKNADVSIFTMLKLDYLRKMHGYPQFSFWISIAPAKICFSDIVTNRAKYLCIRRHRP